MLSEALFKKYLLAPNSELTKFMQKFDDDIQSLSTDERVKFNHNINTLVDEAWRDYSSGLAGIQKLMQTISQSEQKRFKEMMEKSYGKDTIALDFGTIGTMTMNNISLPIMNAEEKLISKIKRSDKSWGILIKKHLDLTQEIRDATTLGVVDATIFKVLPRRARARIRSVFCPKSRLEENLVIILSGN